MSLLFGWILDLLFGDPARLRDTYEDVGSFLEAAAADGYRGFVLTGNPELAEAAGFHDGGIGLVEPLAG